MEPMNIDADARIIYHMTTATQIRNLADEVGMGLADTSGLSSSELVAIEELIAHGAAHLHGAGEFHDSAAHGARMIKAADEATGQSINGID